MASSFFFLINRRNIRERDERSLEDVNMGFTFCSKKKKKKKGPLRREKLDAHEKYRGWALWCLD